MEEFYYQKMDRQKQAVYHGMLQGVRQLADQIQLPRVDGKELYDIFFQMRLDHPEIFWVVGFSWKYYPDSPNLIFVPEYLFEKGKIKEHQIALTSRVEKLARQAQGLSEWEKEKYVHDFICKNVRYDKLKKPYSHEIIGHAGAGRRRLRGNCKGGQGALRRARAMVYDCDLRQQSGKRHQIPPHLEYRAHRRAVLSSGCDI